MEAIELIRGLLKFNQTLTERFVADIPDDRMTEQPHGAVNHAAWQMGHITLTLYTAAHLLGKENKLPDGWQELFGMGSTPKADRAAYPDKGTLVTHLQTAGAMLGDALAGASNADLSKPNPNERLARIFPTTGEFLAGICGPHYAYHHGQLSMWRKVAGLPKAMPA